MTTLEKTDCSIYAPAIPANAAVTAAKRPWYSWLAAVSATLLGLYYLYYLAITPVTNLFAFAWLAAVVLGCFGGAAGFALNRAWGAKFLLAAFVLILPRTAYNAYSVYAITSAGYSSGFAIRLMGSLIATVLSLYTAILSGVTVAAMWRHSGRLAWVVLLLVALPLLIALAIIPQAMLAVR